MPVKISTAQLLQRQRRPSELRYGRRRGDKCAHHCTSHRSTVHMHGCDTDPEFFSLHGRWLSKLSAALERAVETVAQRVSYGCANSRLLPHAGSRSPFFFSKLRASRPDASQARPGRRGQRFYILSGITSVRPRTYAQQRRKQLQKIRQRARVRLCVCARESWAMAAEGPNKAEAEAAKEVGEEKADVPAPGPPADDSKALVVADSK